MFSDEQQPASPPKPRDKGDDLSKRMGRDDNKPPGPLTPLPWPRLSGKGL